MDDSALGVLVFLVCIVGMALMAMGPWLLYGAVPMKMDEPAPSLPMPPLPTTEEILARHRNLVIQTGLRALKMSMQMTNEIYAANMFYTPHEIALSEAKEANLFEIISEFRDKDDGQENRIDHHSE